jgi:hypothetical protein
MASHNRRNFVRGLEVVVTLMTEKQADVFIKRPSDGGERPTPVDLTPLLKGGLAEVDTLDLVLSIVSIGVEGAGI